MEHYETLSGKRLTSILGMGFIAILMLLIFLAWGHLQGRSHEIINLYLESCKDLDLGMASVLTIFRIDRFPFL
jgi:hypothetical protein